MKSLTLLTTILLSAVGANAGVVDTEPVRVFLIDDQTGEELLQKHGIRPVETADMIELLNAAIMGHSPVYLFHQAVDEDASDNALATIVFKPFAGQPRPTFPEGPIPVHQFAEIKKVYDRKRSEWQREILAYQGEVRASTEAFIKQVATTQLEVAQRFDRILEARKFVDFNRSDIVGSLAAANKILGTNGRRILVLNTDAVDTGGKDRKPCRTPITAKDLDPGIELLFVNTSRTPDQAILFAGLPNPIHHADSMREAMRYVAEMLKKPEATTAKK